MAYVYKHTTKDTNVVFYIGIGSGKKYKRANSKCKRNKYWHNIVNKHDFIVEIIKDDITWEEACKTEIELIKKYGRKDLNEGTLVNMTNGGDGRFGYIASIETREKMKKSHIGKVNKLKGTPIKEEVKEKIKDSLKRYWEHNAKLPMTEETKNKIRESLIGRPGTFIGKKHSEESIRKMKLNHGTGENNVRYGSKHSEETIQKMRNSAKTRDNSVYKRKKSEEEKEKLRLAKIGDKNPRYGKKWGEEQKELRRRLILNQPIKKCPYCEKEGKGPTMMKHHFNNCKNKK